MPNSWKINIYRTWDEVDDARFIERWRMWFDAAPDAHVFMHPILVKTWTDVYRSLQEISPLYCVAESGGVTIFMPLVVWRRNWKNAGIRCIVPAGYSDYDYHDPIVVGQADSQVMHSFWQSLMDRLRSGGLGAFDYADFTGIRSPGNQQGWYRTEICPFTDLGRFPDYATAFASLSKSLRKDVNKRRRQLEELGTLTFKVYGRDETAAALEDLPTFLEEHRQKWPNAYKAPGFHEALIRNALPAGLVHYSQLRLDGRPFSWELGLRSRTTAYSYMPVYLKSYSGFSPGKVHLVSLFEDCYQNGITVFDFMRGAEGYKAEWTHSEAGLYRYEAEGHSLQSRLRLKANSWLGDLKQKSLNCSVLAMLFGSCAQDVLNYGYILT